mmetsp:Transcript_24195/g.43722  ORF Transcript_24195/g.43722 Transcript_24195/m.43722 type:complete len:302 (-) Transcript_24195:213-1118(-)
MNDRLDDIGAPSWAAVESDDEEGDVEMANKPQAKYMQSFFRDVDSIKADIDAVKSATRQIHQINEEAQMATTSDKENELSNRLRPLVQATNVRAKRTKNMLALIKNETDTLKEGGDAKSSDIRIRENLSNTLTRKFVDEMKAYQNSQQKYKEDIKKKVKRQVQIVKPDATDEDVENVLKSEGGRDALYKEKILAGGVNDQVKNTYAQVAGKYQDVLTLEQSVAELHQMFLDFALLTEQQGELLDQIEFNVRSAADYVEEGNVDLFESIEFQKKIRKKQCWMMIIAIIATIVILFATGILPP